MIDEATKQRNLKRRAEQAEDGVKAMAEYLAGAEEVRERTARLRALRLQQEAVQATAPPPVGLRPISNPGKPVRKRAVTTSAAKPKAPPRKRAAASSKRQA